ncbi:MAG: hypothetical protein HFE79_13240 [Ruminiclostridium sp.]|nr:hypothetical protein [Ruminiclostridium sp.]
MEKTLKHLFDFHRFKENVRLAEMIADTESRYGNVLPDDCLDKVNAAGELILPNTREDDSDD